MVDYKLSNILLEHNDRFFAYPKMYYKSDNTIVEDAETQSSILLPYSTFDFGTYFGSFSNKKWRRYTIVDNVHFHMEVKGKAKFMFWSVKMQPIGLGKTKIAVVSVNNDEFAPLEFEFPESDDDVFAFSVLTFGTTYIRDGYYYSKVDESKIRDVHVALATTTFKKEDYIRANVALFKDEVVGCNDPVADHASMIVVDNGRTIDASELEGDGVYVFPNKNVGGSGGFARGMIEAKRLDVENPVTHVLIMDDDVSLSSESIKRTHNLLSLVNDDYVEAFVSGAMFSLGDQNIMIEDIGYTNRNGRFGPIKPRRNMEILYDLVKNEDDLPHRRNRYAAFWFCCIPMTTIKREGLPLPLFIRYDDAEYGQRCKPKFMTMNGINIWHEDFDDRYNAFYERYCGTRNSLVIQATSGVCPKVDFFNSLFDECFVREIKKFNYGSAELLLDGLDDFMKGPEFLEDEHCEAILKEKMALCEKFTPLEELDFEDINLEVLSTKKKLGSYRKRFDKWTYNGQRFTPDFLLRSDPIGVRFNANSYQEVIYHLRKTVLVVNRLGTRGFFRKRDVNRFAKLMKRYKVSKRYYEQHHEEVEARYAAANEYLKSDDFWKRYLEIV